MIRFTTIAICLSLALPQVALGATVYPIPAEKPQLVAVSDRGDVSPLQVRAQGREGGMSAAAEPVKTAKSSRHLLCESGVLCPAFIVLGTSY